MLYMFKNKGLCLFYFHPKDAGNASNSVLSLWTSLQHYESNI